MCSCGVAAHIYAEGGLDATAQDLRFHITGLAPSEMGLLFMGSAEQGVPLFGSDGLLCAGGSLLRVAPVQSSAIGYAVVAPALAGLVQPGDVTVQFE